jgi:two-component system sensor histidine kinase HydH
MSAASSRHLVPPDLPLTTVKADDPNTDDRQRIEELGQIVRAYNEVTERLHASHELLNREVARLQHELASANTALQRSRRLAALGEMAAGIAHEIRNPLASIQLYADVLRADLADRPEQRDVALRIGEAVRGLNSIVNDVLTFSREIKVRPIPVDLEELLCRALGVVQPALDSEQIEVIVDVDDQAIANLDAELIHQALVNLIRNAAEAMPHGGRLTLVGRRGDADVSLIVRDTGPGIADAEIDRIFNPFFTTRATGTGLGLAIVHRIVDAHGGSIAVHNDGGAVFTVTLPTEPSLADEERSVNATANHEERQ